MANENREYTLPLTLINAAAAGNDVIFDLEQLRGLRIKQIILEGGNTASGATTAPTNSAIFEEIFMEYGRGTLIDNVTAAEIDTIQTQYGTKYASTGVAGGSNGAGRRFHTLFFAQPQRGDLYLGNRLGLETHEGAIGKNGKLTLKVKLKSGITPSVRGWAVVDGIQTKGPHPVVFLDAHDVDTGGSSSTISKILDAEGEVLEIDLFDPSDATIESVDVRILENGKKNAILDDVPKAANAHKLKSTGEMTVIAGLYPAVFDASGTLNTQVPCTGLTIKSTFSGAAAALYRVIVQRLALP